MIKNVNDKTFHVKVACFFYGIFFQELEMSLRHNAHKNWVCTKCSTNKWLAQSILNKWLAQNILKGLDPNLAIVNSGLVVICRNISRLHVHPRNKFTS